MRENGMHVCCRCPSYEPVLKAVVDRMDFTYVCTKSPACTNRWYVLLPVPPCSFHCSSVLAPLYCGKTPGHCDIALTLPHMTPCCVTVVHRSVPDSSRFSRSATSGRTGCCVIPESCTRTCGMHRDTKDFLAPMLGSIREAERQYSMSDVRQGSIQYQQQPKGHVRICQSSCQVSFDTVYFWK